LTQTLSFVELRGRHEVFEKQEEGCADYFMFAILLKKLLLFFHINLCGQKRFCLMSIQQFLFNSLLPINSYQAANKRDTFKFRNDLYQSMFQHCWVKYFFCIERVNEG
jgi:hypothetical protein